MRRKRTLAGAAAMGLALAISRRLAACGTEDAGGDDSAGDGGTEAAEERAGSRRPTSRWPRRSATARAR